MGASVAHAGRCLARSRLTGQLVRFAAIGVVSTVAYVLLYALLRSDVAAGPANAVALVVDRRGQHGRAIAASRSGRASRTTAWQDQAVGLVALGMALVITTGALDLLRALGPGSGPADRGGRTGGGQRAGDRRALRWSCAPGWPRARALAGRRRSGVALQPHHRDDPFRALLVLGEPRHQGGLRVVETPALGAVDDRGTRLEARRHPPRR